MHTRTRDSWAKGWGRVNSPGKFLTIGGGAAHRRCVSIGDRRIRGEEKRYRVAACYLGQ